MLLKKRLIGVISQRKFGSIVGICNPLVDMTLEVSDPSFLEEYKIRPGNAILADSPIHKQLIKDVWQMHLDTPSKVLIVPGGSGMNTIRAANVRSDS